MTLQQYGLESLSREERLELAQVLWDSVDATTDLGKEPPELLAELARRAALSDADPDRGTPWETVRAEARARWAK
jgi:putative addiction module component (TIGR02574 family)